MARTGRNTLRAVVAVGLVAPASHAAVIFGNMGINFGSRWDAAPRTILGEERSLTGGLRYAMQGGSYAGYRDLFTWRDGTPSASAFTALVENAFAAWTAVDPVTGLGTDVSFVHDPTTSVQGVSDPSQSVNFRGAEIDLFGVTNARFWNPGNSRQQGESFFSTAGFTNSLTLTSGTTGYSGFPIRGADIRMNANPQVRWDFEDFGVILTHEIGHALGFGDVDLNFGQFIDDNYDDTNATTARETLTNPWAQLVDVDDPSNSPLALYEVANANPGVDTSEVDILMETNIPQAFFNAGQAELSNDDFGGRQFLYPWIAPIVSGMFGDFDGDGAVRQGDLNLVLNNWGNTRGNWSNADGFSSFAVDQEELNAVLNNWGSSASPSFASNPAVVPEPALAAVAGFSIALFERRRASNRPRR